jgi:hypothetical protein
MKVQFSELTFVLKSPPIANLRHVISKHKTERNKSEPTTRNRNDKQKEK